MRKTVFSYELVSCFQRFPLSTEYFGEEGFALESHSRNPPLVSHTPVNTSVPIQSFTAGYLIGSLRASTRPTQITFLIPYGAFNPIQRPVDGVITWQA